jgi:hypothetical protein
MGVLHGVREKMRESERSLQSSKEWDDVVAVFPLCKLLICINIAVLWVKSSPILCCNVFHFCDFQSIFGLIFDLVI